ncbi:hypothetical protein [Gordonia malaquae]|uniref:hypothetical protein n=1 Tax=Gordonia malaquae TaxID=410332 RepID=UPI00301865D4
MAEISVQAASLGGLLLTLRETLGKPGDNPGMDGVVLYTDRVDTPQGRMQVLVGVSTDAAVASSMSIMCNGELRTAAMVPQAYLVWLVEILNEVARDDKDSLVSVRIDDDGRVARLLIETRQNNQHTFPLEDMSRFPLDGVRSRLSSAGPTTITDREGRELPAGNLLVIPGQYLSLMSKMGKRFSSPVKCFTTGHPAGPLLVSVGPWRASLPGSGYPYDAEVDFPEPQIPADLPVEKDDSAGQ